VKVLADTHVLLWALADSPLLSRRAREVLQDSSNECWASGASVWEIAIKTQIGKYRLGFPLARLENAIDAAGFHPLDITVRHAAALERVKVSHSDPFDRLLLAQCEIETLRLLTADRLLVDQAVALPC